MRETEEMRSALDEMSGAVSDLVSGLDRMEKGGTLPEVARACVTVDEAISSLEFQIGRIRAEFDGIKSDYLFGKKGGEA